MANRDLLKEAIADAKSVKEAAIANAKAALEEAFTPYLKEKFSAKLAEMEAEEEMEETISEEGMEERLGTINDPASEEPHGNLEEEDEMVDEMDLDELLAELDEELGETQEMEETLNEAEEEEVDVDVDDDSEEVEGEEDEEIDLEDMTEDELKSLIEDVIADMVRAGEIEAGESFEAEDENEESEEDVDVDVDAEEVTLDENERTDAEEEGYLDGMHDEKEDMEEGITDKLKAVWNDPEMLGKIITVDGKKMSLKDFLGMASSATSSGKSGLGESPFQTEAMDEMKQELEELASNLAETKLLNAKLLYVNKIFRAKNLTEIQKVKVLESFDKATTIKDAKLIYETLTLVKETKTAVTESMRGMASKAIGIAPEKKPILEVDNQFARWQVLAGIKKH